MKPKATGMEAVRRHMEKRIERVSARIARARKSTRSKPRGARRAQAGVATDLAVRRAYRDALAVLDAEIPPNVRVAQAERLVSEEFARVKSAVAKIYEVTQHANHDIADAGDWSIVEGEAEAALNVFKDADAGRG
jgi:hypothetical protein